MITADSYLNRLNDCGCDVLRNCLFLGAHRFLNDKGRILQMLLGQIGVDTLLSCSHGFHRALYHFMVRVDHWWLPWLFEKWAPIILLTCRAASINLGNKTIGFRLRHCLSFGFEGVSEVLYGTWIVDISFLILSSSELGLLLKLLWRRLLCWNWAFIYWWRWSKSFYYNMQHHISYAWSDLTYCCFWEAAAVAGHLLFCSAFVLGLASANRVVKIRLSLETAVVANCYSFQFYN